MKTNTITTILFVVLLLTLNACQQEPTNTAKIGGIFALTGYGAEWGTAEQQAVELVLEEAGIELVSEDSKTDQNAALTALSKLTEVDGVKYVIGPTWEASASTLAPVAAEKNIIMISPSSYKGIQLQQSPFLFSTYPPYGYEIENMKEYFAEKGFKKFIIVHHQAFFSQVMRDVFAEEAAKNNWVVVTTLEQPVEDKDFRTILLKIKEIDADAIYLPLETDDPDKGLFMKQMKELGVQLPVISTASTQNENLLKNYGSFIEGIIYAFPTDTPEYAVFEAKFEQKYGKKPGSPSAAVAYDAANLLIQALKNAKTPEEVSAYLHSVKDYQGASNVITFDENGIVSSKKYIVKTVKDGTFAELS